MGYLSAPSSGMPDAQKISLSFWARIPSAGSTQLPYGGGNIIEFGQYQFGPPQSSSVNVFANAPDTIDFNSFSFNFYTNIMDIDGPTGPFSSTGFSSVGSAGSSPGKAVSLDTWYNYMVSIDISSLVGAAWSCGPGPSPASFYVPCWMFINGVSISPSDNGPGTVQVDGIPVCIQGNGTYTVTSASLTVNTYEIAVPVTAAHAAANNNDPIILAEYQAWFGTFIDFSNPGIRALFIDNHGKPVDPATPAGVFGAQSILLRRNKDLGLHFTLNEGVGDTLISAGSFTDFTTGPGQ